MLDQLLLGGILHSRGVSFQPGDYLYRAGQFSEQLYWLARGCVGSWPEPAATDGDVLEAPTLLGSSHLLDGRCRRTVRALSPCEAWQIERRHLLASCGQCPGLNVYLLRQLSRELLRSKPHYE